MLETLRRSMTRFRYLIFGAISLLRSETPARSLAIAVVRFLKPDSARRHAPIRSFVEEPCKDFSPDFESVGYFVHLFYMDYAQRFVDALDADLSIVNVHVSTPSHQIKAFLESWKKESGREVDIVLAPNRGRNFGPLLVDFRKSILRYEFIVHIHSKKSSHQNRRMANNWADRSWLLLFENKQLLRRSLSLIQSRSDISVMSPLVSDLIPPESFSWLCNEPAGARLAKRLGISSSDSRFAFPAGGMFLARTEVLRALFDLEWKRDDFPEENGQIDGTTQHAVERIIGVLASKHSARQVFFDFKSSRFTDDSSFLISDNATIKPHYF